MGHFTLLPNGVNPFCPAVPHISPERNRPNLSEPVENVVSAEMQGFTIADLCPAVEKAWDSFRLSFVPCPMSQEKNF